MPSPLDVHALVELLGDGHGAPGGHVQLPGGLLLEGGGDEGGRRGTVLVLALDLTHREGAACGWRPAPGPRPPADLSSIFFSRAVKLGFEAALVGGHPVQGDLQGPVLLGHEGPDLLLPLAPPAGWPRTAPARRTGPGGSFSTAGGRAHSPRSGPESAGPAGHPPGSGRSPGGGDALGDHFLGDLVEGDPAGLVVRQVQQLLQMPGNGLPLPVRVGGQVDVVGCASAAFFSSSMTSSLPLMGW